MTDDRLAALEQRLQHIEDERAIERLIASYGPLVDAGEADAAAQLWAVDGVYDVERWAMHGRDAVASMVRSDAHQRLIRSGCCHFLGPAVVSLDGDEAVAVCESVLLAGRDDGLVVLRAGANYFRLRRIDDRWQIITRITRALNGKTEAGDLLSDGVAGRVRPNPPG